MIFADSSAIRKAAILPAGLISFHWLGRLNCAVNDTQRMVFSVVLSEIQLHRRLYLVWDGNGEDGASPFYGATTDAERR